MQSFTEWAQATSAQNRVCKVCALPAEWYAQLITAREQGYRSVTLSKFLRDNGFEVSASSLDNHFIRGGGHGR